MGSRRGPDPSPATPSSAPFGAIATVRGPPPQSRRTDSPDGSAGMGRAIDSGTKDSTGMGHAIDSSTTELSVLLWNSNATFNCTADCDVTVTLKLPSAVPRGSSVRVYRMDMVHGNPAAVFLRQRDGNPSLRPYPTPAEFEAIRAAAELPVCGVSGTLRAGWGAGSWYWRAYCKRLCSRVHLASFPYAAENLVQLCKQP